ncbi:hypothetical protein KIM67_05740 [Flagellimonas sp. 389]|uniref:hypothetical protein n=1 Tax=Flagellimonas sp. 389 TaxID=2835862 RepID=UPI001BD40F5F|nr:hypothetical protein [Flagellimonas sp. 389]MBS9461905.1 hypothetical protein [Flagellimonas sp. 389]
MARLNSKQTNELAKIFLAYAQAIGDYRYKNYASLTRAQNKRLREYHKRTLDYSDDLFTMSAKLVMNDAEEALSKLTAITEQMEKSYASLINVQKAIGIATAIVTLGASVFSLNPQAISEAIGSLSDIFETEV